MTDRHHDRPHALYRFYSATGQLLYVGITNNPGARFHQHQQDKPWWTDVAGISVEQHPTRRDALDAETRAINVENPLHNKQRPGLRPKTTRTPARPAGLVWVCEDCRQPITDGTGYLHLEHAELAEAKRTAPQDHRASSWAPMDLGAWLDWEPARWHSHHAACDPTPDDSAYSFDVSRARTHARLLSWTAHLMGKSWIEHTDWIDLIERMAGVDA